MYLLLDLYLIKEIINSFSFMQKISALYAQVTYAPSSLKFKLEISVHMLLNPNIFCN